MIKNAIEFLNTYKNVYTLGLPCETKSQRFIEIENAKIVLNPLDNPFTSFKARQLNIGYAKQEFLWYLRADRFDDSICNHATMWQKLKQADGGFNSNYGQYIFNDNNGRKSQFEYVIDTLINDSDSRRASIVLLNQDHLYTENSDVVCTYAINFRLRNNYLNMTVHMRSNDVIFGTTNDVFCFVMLYRLIFACVNKHKKIYVGQYTHLVDSLHVYERHYEMIKKIISDGLSGYTHITDIPELSTDESSILRELIRKDRYKNEIIGPWTAWLQSSIH